MMSSREGGYTQAVSTYNVPTIYLLRVLVQTSQHSDRS
jgi:hypothetical protein